MINNLFQAKQLFIGFITGGDGGVAYCVECCLQMIAGGVDMIEIGLPFSDPVADGPVIQRSSQRALDLGTNAETILEIAREIRKHSTVPLVLFSYYNPLLQKGESFLSEAKLAGYDAVLVVDLPVLIEEDDYSYFRIIKESGLCPIFLASPSTDDARLKKITEAAEGFIYYACQKGTTGIKATLPPDFSHHIDRIRQVTNLPIVAGFGIADQISAKSVIDHADGFVVGSAFVNLMAINADPIELKKLAKTIDPRD